MGRRVALCFAGLHRPAEQRREGGQLAINSGRFALARQLVTPADDVVLSDGVQSEQITVAGLEPDGELPRVGKVVFDSGGDAVALVQGFGKDGQDRFSDFFASSRPPWAQDLALLRARS